ncbi:Probable aminotransferase ACS12 [Linum grandiflorum]
MSLFYSFTSNERHIDIILSQIFISFYSPLSFTSPTLAAGEMRLVVHGRGGLILGSLIPCALFYFLQLYLKRHRSPPTEAPILLLLLLPRRIRRRRPLRLPTSSSSPGAPPAPICSAAKPNESPYYIGLEKVNKDPNHRRDNPDGIMQSENRLCLDLIEKWMHANVKDALMVMS